MDSVEFSSKTGSSTPEDSSTGAPKLLQSNIDAAKRATRRRLLSIVLAVVDIVVILYSGAVKRLTE